MEKSKEKTNLVEIRHRFIGAANLDLEVGSLLPSAVAIWTQDRGLGRVLELIVSAKDVLFFLVDKDFAREDGLIDRVLVRASPALEPVAANVHLGEDQKVGAEWADCKKLDTFLVMRYVGQTHIELAS